MKVSDLSFEAEGEAIYRIVRQKGDGFLNWTLEPVGEGVLEESEGFFLLSALAILPDKTRVPCYMNMTMSERISDFAIYYQDGEIKKTLLYELAPVEIIPNVAIAWFGIYELYYSKIDPEAGLDVLRRGLKQTENSGEIARDMGYILRDENRHEEAIEAFRHAILLGNADEYVYRELITLLRLVGRSDEEDEWWEKLTAIVGEERVKRVKSWK